MNWKQLNHGPCYGRPLNPNVALEGTNNDMTAFGAFAPKAVLGEYFLGGTTQLL
jgi:hypothetical protein